MTIVLTFSITLMIAVLISERAERSIISTSVLFLFAGILAGGGGLGVIRPSPDDPVVSTFAELALFSVLFADGMRVTFRELAGAWHLPGRALLLGLPLTLGGYAVLGHWIVGLPWSQAFLVGAILSPTDPVFAEAIVGREEVPGRLRSLLNIESGLNDGLALPVVVAMLSLVAVEEFHPGHVASEVALGVVVGVVVPALMVSLNRLAVFGASEHYRPLHGFAIGLMILSIGKLSHANLFLAAFTGGVTVASVDPRVREQFLNFGGLIAELLKLAALLMFGALITPAWLSEASASSYVFAVASLVTARPLALAISLVGSHLDRRERIVVAWFGPKGFASVVFGLLVLRDAQSGRLDVETGQRIFRLIALCVVGSIVAHSSTDVLVARWFQDAEGKPDRIPQDNMNG